MNVLTDCVRCDVNCCNVVMLQCCNGGLSMSVVVRMQANGMLC